MATTSNTCPVLSLLIVEDDLSAIDVLSALLPLKFPEVAVYIAVNGNQGMAIFERHTPDIVVTDINMPGMGGIQMVEAIRAMKPDTRFIAVSGYSDKINLDKFSALGISDYIVKPVDCRILFSAIEKNICEIMGHEPSIGQNHIVPEMSHD